MPMAERLTDEELEIISEKLLAKLLTRLARRQQAENDRVPPPRRQPSPEVIAEVLARKRRSGK